MQKNTENLRQKYVGERKHSSYVKYRIVCKGEDVFSLDIL